MIRSDSNVCMYHHATDKFYLTQSSKQENYVKVKPGIKTPCFIKLKIQFDSAMPMYMSYLH